MQDLEILESIVVAPDDLARVLDLYEKGLCLQAYEASRAIGPLKRWAGPSAMVIAGRLALNLCAPRLATSLHLRAGRLYPGDFEVRYYFARSLAYRRGNLDALKFMKDNGDLEGASDYLQADWLAFQAILLGHLRDFDAAERLLARAERIKPDWPWVILERMHLLELEDRLVEALAFGRHALEVRPWYRPAVQAVAQALQSLDRDGEAIDLLTEAADRLESAPVVIQLATLQAELGRSAEAARNWERVIELSPLMEKAPCEWLAARRSDAAYDLGEIDKAAAFARESKQPFFLRLAERFEKPDIETRRVMLDVGFVRQHHQTCAPATLSAISRYLKLPAEHLEVAEAICYDGTPDHRERSWASTDDRCSREFTVGWEAAVTLLDAGIPFTLTTIEPGSAHLQAVIGYDARRGTLLIRDPSHRQYNEMAIDRLVENYRSTGPRGMAFVPADQAARLDALNLPDSDAYDLLHQFQRALHLHDRASATDVFATMEERYPEHRLTLNAGRILAIYDLDTTRLLGYVDRLLKLFPDDPLLLLSKLGCLREQGRRETRLAILKAIVDDRESDPIFRRHYADELSDDARERPLVLRLLRKVARQRPGDDMPLASLGNVHWELRRFEEATTLYRFASCLDDKDEGHARSFFVASRHLSRTDEALAFLNERFRRLGARSAQPARTLYWAYDQCDRLTEALALIDEAAKLRPDDGDLLLFASEQLAALGEFDRAVERLNQAKGRCRPAAWLRAAATLAAAKGQPFEALTLWVEVLKSEPTSLEAHRRVTRLLAETSGRETAIASLQVVCERFPHNYPLQQLLIQWLRDEEPHVFEPAIRRLVETHPSDAWARRELAVWLGDRRRFDEALDELDLAERLEPNATALFHAKGQVLSKAGRIDEAKEAFRQAIRLSIDSDYAQSELLGLSRNRAERVEALSFIEAELARQVVFGDGLLAYRRLAQTTFPPEVLLEKLAEAWKARPDLWQSWTVYAAQLVEAGRPDDAREVAIKAVERFPLLPRLRLELAEIEGARGDREAKIQALREALRINPGWSTAVRMLAQTFEDEGRFEESRQVLEPAVNRDPLDYLNQGYLADALWRTGEKELAIERIRRSITLFPDYDWAWRCLHQWCSELERPDESIALARELTEKRSGDPTVWLILARQLDGADTLDERLEALGRAIELDPRLAEAHDLRAQTLVEAGRFDEARVASRPEAFGDHVPLFLKGRGAWVEEKAGHLAEAIEQMNAVVQEDPDYVWGWRRLSEWRQEGPPEALLEACEQVVRLAPESAMSYAYRGDARLALKDRVGAIADFQKASTLDPSYLYAVLSLFDLQFEDKAFDDAAGTLALVDEASKNQYSIAREVQLAGARDRPQEAEGPLAKLCRTPGNDYWPFSSVMKVVKEKGWFNLADKVFTEALDDPEVNLRVASCWVELRTSGNDWRCLDRIELLQDRDGLADEALETFLQEAGKARAVAPVDDALKRFGERIKASTRLWGIAGYALTSLPNRNRKARDFMADWQGRSEVMPWMLGNYVIALRAAGQVKTAREAGLFATTLPIDNCSVDHLLWLANDDAIARRYDEAAQRLEGIDPHDPKETNRALYRIAATLVEISRQGVFERMGKLGPALERLRIDLESTNVSVEDRDAVRATYRRAMADMAWSIVGPFATVRILRALLLPPSTLR